MTLLARFLCTRYHTSHQRLRRLWRSLPGSKSGCTLDVHKVQLNQKEMRTFWGQQQQINDILDSPSGCQAKKAHHQDENCCHHLKDSSSLNGYTVKLARELNLILTIYKAFELWCWSSIVVPGCQMTNEWRDMREVRRRLGRALAVSPVCLHGSVLTRNKNIHTVHTLMQPSPGHQRPATIRRP